MSIVLLGYKGSLPKAPESSLEMYLKCNYMITQWCCCLFVCLLVSFTKADKIRHSSMNYVSWRLQSIPSLVHSMKSPRRFLSILCQTIEDNTVYIGVIEVIIFFYHYYSRTPVTRTLRGNEKQFQIAGISSYRGKF